MASIHARITKRIQFSNGIKIYVSAYIGHAPRKSTSLLLNGDKSIPAAEREEFKSLQQLLFGSSSPRVTRITKNNRK